VLSERFDLPPDASGILIDMRRAAEAEKQQLLANKDIAPDRMAEALKEIQTETQKAARQELGDQAYQQYAPSAAWLQGLGTN
jgi:hypothetical protein